MTKEQAFSAAEKLLLNIYSEDVMICGKICAASADKNSEYIWGSLDEVVKFCNKLKEAIKEK